MVGERFQGRGVLLHSEVRVMGQLRWTGPCALVCLTRTVWESWLGG